MGRRVAKPGDIRGTQASLLLLVHQPDGSAYRWQMSFSREPTEPSL